MSLPNQTEKWNAQIAYDDAHDTYWTKKKGWLISQKKADRIVAALRVENDLLRELLEKKP